MDERFDNLLKQRFETREVFEPTDVRGSASGYTVVPPPPPVVPTDAEPQTETNEPSILDEFGDFAGNVATTFGDLPNMALRGTLHALGEAVYSAGLIDKDTADVWRKMLKSADKLAEKEGVNPVARGLGQGLAQFGAGMIGPFKALRAVGVARPLAALVAEGLSGAFAFNPDDPNLGNFINSFEPENPIVKNIADYIQTDPNDTEAENRFRNLVQDVVPTAVVESIVKGVKTVREMDPDTIIEAGEAAEKRLSDAMSGTTLSANPVGAVGDAAIAGAGKVAQKLKRVGTTGQYVGAPAGITSPQKLAGLRRKMLNLTKEGGQGRFWYERSGQQILDAVGGNVDEADKIIQAIAVTSPGTPVKSNFDYALQAYSQWKAGEPILTGRFPTAMSKKLEEIFSGKPWEGRKTDDFYNNLMIQIDPSRAGPVTGDIWMLRAFGFAKANEMPSPKQYEFMTKETQRIADQLGWEPHQVQASIWVNMKARSENPGVKKITEEISEKEGWITWKTNSKGKKERVVLDEVKHMQNWLKQSLKYTPNVDDINKAKFDYADALQGNLGQVSWESIPGRTGNHMPEMFNAPYAQQAEYHVAVSKAFLDDDGTDIIAKELGILSPRDFEAPGYFEGKVSPGTQTEIVLPQKYKGPKLKQIEPAALELVQTYSAIRGILLKQDAMGWHRPFYKHAVKDSNGVEVSIGRNFTEAETDKLAKHIAEIAGHKDFNPISSPDGVRFINFIGMDNTKFHAILNEALQRMEFDDGANAVAKRFAAQSGYMENNWSKYKNGEGYLGTSLKGRSDLQRKVRRIISKIQARIDDVDSDFSERYGWTRNEELNAGHKSPNTVNPEATPPPVEGGG